MLQIIIPETELFDERTSRFITRSEVVLQLEHSLVSISKWEAKWHKPFLSKDNKTTAEIASYIKCMDLSGNVSDTVISCLGKKEINQINDYINDSMTATTFRETQKKGGREIITAEIVYYWMVELQIPFECQYWHFNKLLTLIRVCNEKKSPKKKMSKSDILKQNASLNAARRQASHSKG